jgi:hypothetical protein
MIEWEEVKTDGTVHPMRTQWHGKFYGRTLAITGREGSYNVLTGTDGQPGMILRKTGLATIKEAKEWAQERYGH